MTRVTRRRVLAIAAGTVATAIAGCTSRADDGSTETPGSSPSGTPTDTASPTPADGTPTPDTSPTAQPTTADRADVIVDMRTDNKGSYFDPIGLLVESGTTVRFVNATGVHTTTAYHPDVADVPLRIPEAAEPWDSGTMTEAGAVCDVTFETPGVYDYYCIPHESLGMVGRIIVGEPQGGPGTTEPTDLPPAARENLPSIEAILDEGSVAGP